MGKIICISGKQYSGKDTLAKILLNELDDFVRVGIADSIKIEYGKRCGLSLKEIEQNKSNYRSDLIKLGNEGRNFHPDFWLNKILEMKQNIIVPDVRLLHEAEVFKSKGAFLIRVEASCEVREKRGIITNQVDSTEVELDNFNEFDYIIENNSTEIELIDNSKPLIKILKENFV